MIAQKNAQIPGLSQGLGLGLGDDLLTQVENQILQRRKQALAVPGASPLAYGATGFGVSPAPGSGLSPAVLGLLGNGGFNG